jgi:hypothetical protein
MGIRMRAFIAGCVAVGILLGVDAEMNGGRYRAVVQKAIISILPR